MALLGSYPLKINVVISLRVFAFRIAKQLNLKNLMQQMLS